MANNSQVYKYEISSATFCFLSSPNFPQDSLGTTFKGVYNDLNNWIGVIVTHKNRINFLSWHLDPSKEHFFPINMPAATPPSA